MNIFRIRRLAPALPGSMMLLSCVPILVFSIEQNDLVQGKLDAIRQEVTNAEARLMQLQRDQPVLRQAAANLRYWLPPAQPSAQSATALQAIHTLFGISELQHEWRTDASAELPPTHSTQWLERSMHLSFKPLHEGFFLDVLKRLHETEQELAVVDACSLAKDVHATLKADCDLRWFSLQTKRAGPP